MCFFSPRLFPPAQVSRIPQNPTAMRPGKTTRPAPCGRRTARSPRAARWHTRPAQRAVDGQLAEAARERGLGSNREHLPPPARVRGRDRAALRRGAGESPATSELLQESLRLLSENDEAATPHPLELGVSGVSPWAAAAVTPEGAHKRDVNCDLDSSEGGKAIRDNLQPAPVRNGHPDVQVAKGNVGRNPGRGGGCCNFNSHSIRQRRIPCEGCVICHVLNMSPGLSR